MADTYHPAREILHICVQAQNDIRRIADREAARAKARPWDKALQRVAETSQEVADWLACAPSHTGLGALVDDVDPHCLLDGSRTALQVAVAEIAAEREDAT
jgi:hypothetical protein